MDQNNPDPSQIANRKSAIANASSSPLPPPPTSLQFEALCRHAISRLYTLPISEIHTGRLTGASRNRTHTQHQIDLHWTISDGVCNYLLFANAKWKSPQFKVTLPDLMTLVGVWHDIGAHKAMLITNTGFHTGVITQAKEKGIALLIVRPTEFFDPTILPRQNTPQIQQAIEDQAALHPTQPLFTHELIHRAFTLPASFNSAFSTQPSAFPPAARSPNPHSEFHNPQSQPPTPPQDSSPPDEEDFTYLIESSAPSEETFDNKMLNDSATTHKMVDNAPDPEPPPAPPFGIRTK